jgi:hypothetical protein
MVASLSPHGRCPTDGTTLESGGFCRKGQGIPYFTEDEQGLKRRACEFACPICRKLLDWSGACRGCHGTTTGRRKDWAFPGDRYDRFADDGLQIGDGLHWVKTDGPRMACTIGMNVENAAMLQRVAGRFAIRLGQEDE